MFKAVSEGARGFDIIAIAANTKPWPCGACRQVMRDFGDKDTLIVLSARTPEDYMENTLDELLPFSFGPESI